jgi:hypothetical protein
MARGFCLGERVGILLILLPDGSQQLLKERCSRQTTASRQWSTATISAGALRVALLHWRISAERGPNSNCRTPHVRHSLSGRLCESMQEHHLQALSRPEKLGSKQPHRSTVSLTAERFKTACNVVEQASKLKSEIMKTM